MLQTISIIWKNWQNLKVYNIYSLELTKLKNTYYRVNFLYDHKTKRKDNKCSKSKNKTQKVNYLHNVQLLYKKGKKQKRSSFLCKTQFDYSLHL